MNTLEVSSDKMHPYFHNQRYITQEDSNWLAFGPTFL